MSDRPEPIFVAETLAWCNERRAEKRLQPLAQLPKGKRADSESCPCGEATGLSVGCATYGSRSGNDDHQLPNAVRAFVRAFDAGQLPQYEVEA